MSDPRSATYRSTAAPSGPYKNLQRNERCWMIRSGKEEDIEHVEMCLQNICAGQYDFVQWQVEQGEETGFVHVQGMIYHDAKIKGRTLQNKFPPGTEIQVAKSKEALLYYTSKERTRIRGPFTYGKMPEQGKRSDLKEHAQQFLSNETGFLSEHPDVYLRYHRGFESLKSKKYTHRTSAPVITFITADQVDEIIDKGVQYYVKDATKFWCGYDQQQNVFVKEDWWIDNAPFGIEKRWQVNVEIKGGHIPFNSPLVWVIQSVKDRREIN